MQGEDEDTREKFSAYLAPRDVARILKLSLDTVYEDLRSGRLKGTKIRRQWRVDPEELKRFIKDGGN